jgi:hypothetical protein
MDNYKPDYRKIHEIYLNQIIFEKKLNSTAVTIFGYYEDSDIKDLVRVDYWCEFSVLTDLLLSAKEDGEPIINAITEKLNDNDQEYPTVIDVENMFGKPLKIDGSILTIYRPKEKNENGEWEEDDDDVIYIIESIEVKESSGKEEKSKENLREQLNENFTLLESMYKYYSQLLKLGDTEKSAREKAGLNDDLLFKITVLNHKINQDENKN